MLEPQRVEAKNFVYFNGPTSIILNTKLQNLSSGYNIEPKLQLEATSLVCIHSSRIENMEKCKCVQLAGALCVDKSPVFELIL